MSKKTVDNEGFTSIPDSHAPVAKTQSTAVATYTAGRGFEGGVHNEDLIIPRAKLLQPTADELTNPDCNFRAGQIINSLTKEVLTSTFIPILYTKEYMRFNGRKGQPNYDPAFEPGQLMWRTKDENDERVKTQCAFGPNGEVPLGLTVLSFMCLFEGQDMPVILSFTKTSYKAGRNLLSLTKFSGGDMFSKKYKLGTVSVKGEDGNYFVLKVDPAGKCSDEEFKKAEGYFNNFAPKRDNLNVHEGEAA